MAVKHSVSSNGSPFLQVTHLIIFRIKRKYVSDLIAVFTEYYGNREEVNGSLDVGMAQKLYTSG